MAGRCHLQFSNNRDVPVSYTHLDVYKRQTLQGLAQINKESIDAIREAVRELERAGYIERSRERDERGCLRGTVYTIYEQSHMDSAPGQPGHGNIMRSHVRIRPAHSEGAAGTWRPSMRRAKHKRLSLIHI